MHLSTRAWHPLDFLKAIISIHVYPACIFSPYQKPPKGVFSYMAKLNLSPYTISYFGGFLLHGKALFRGLNKALTKPLEPSKAEIKALLSPS